MFKTEKKNAFLANKGFGFLFQLRNMGEKFVDSYSENREKHVMNSIIDFLKTGRGMEKIWLKKSSA